MARTTRNSRSKKGTVSVDFTGVESSGKLQEGRQLLTVDGAPEVKTSDSSGTDYINWKLKGKGGAAWHTTSLQPQALWNLRNVLEALGLEVPEGSLDLDLSEMDGLTLGAEVVHEVYQGKKKAVLVDIFPASELDGEEQEEEQEGEEEESELPSYEEVQEADKAELLDLAEEHEVKLTLKQKKSVQAMRDAICEALELEEGEGEEEGESELTLESLEEMSKEELIQVAADNDIKLTVRQKKTNSSIIEVLAEKLELEEEEKEEPKTTSRRKKSGSSELKKGSTVTFTDDGEDIEGVVKSINVKEKFAVVDVEGDEWEVELSDLTVA